jgi:hypothetical protein
MGVHNSHMHDGDCKLPIQALEIAVLGLVCFLQQIVDTSNVSFMSCEINLRVITL